MAASSEPVSAGTADGVQEVPADPMSPAGQHGLPSHPIPAPDGLCWVLCIPKHSPGLQQPLWCSFPPKCQPSSQGPIFFVCGVSPPPINSPVPGTEQVVSRTAVRGREAGPPSGLSWGTPLPGAVGVGGGRTQAAGHSGTFQEAQLQIRPPCIFSSPLPCTHAWASPKGTVVCGPPRVPEP